VTELLIDATGLHDGSEFRGIGTYLRELLTRLAPIPDLSTTALVLPGTELPAGISPATVTRRAPGRFRAAEHELLLPLDLRRHRAAAFHSPAGTPPYRCSVPWVQTLHDVIPLIYDDSDLAGERRRLRRAGRRMRGADVVIAISRHTANTGIAELGLDPKRVEVIPHGVGEQFEPSASPPVSDQPYLLLVSEYSRRKGYPEAFAVVGELAERSYPHVLHVSGRIAPWVEPTVRSVVAQAPHPERIRLLGFVDDLVGQYQGAAALLVTSRYEGFGLPVLEAMACGTPVIAFDNSSLPEVVGDAGVLVPDGDVRAMATAARELLDHPQRREELAQAGIERARTFDWKRSVAMHADIYRSLAR
jgi:glycosyltransferase involved in cell wall biosynthesis